MSIEAPTAPQNPDTLTQEDSSTGELPAEQARRRRFDASNGRTSEAPPRLVPDEALANEPAPSYFEDDDPEKVPDARNRAIDHEILGRAVRVRETIRSEGTKAASKVDKLLAKTVNMFEMPREAYRKWHMNRAEKSLKKKEDRLEKKQQKWQATLDSTGSGRLHQRRQDKAAKAYEKEKYKVDQYKTQHVEHRQEKYKESVTVRASRLEKSDGRQGERQTSARESRDEAINRKAVALGKKELRARLRGPENNASRRETRQIMEEILGEETAAQKLRQLGRTVVGRQLSETKLNRSIYEQGSTAETVTRLSGLITKEQRQQGSIRSRIEMAKRDFTRVQRVLNGETGDNGAQPELELFKEQGVDIFTPEGLREITDRIQEEEEMLENSRSQVTEVEARLANARTRLKSQEEQTIAVERNTARERSSTDIQARDILN